VTTSPLDDARKALHAVTGVLRLCVVVERVRKQRPTSKEKGGKRIKSSEWVDTDEYTVTLFDGGSIGPFNHDEALSIVAAINGAISDVLLPNRTELITRLSGQAQEPLTLEGAKYSFGLLKEIENLENQCVAILPCSVLGTSIRPTIQSPLTLTGTDTDMKRVRDTLTARLGTILNPEVNRLTALYRKAVGGIK